MEGSQDGKQPINPHKLKSVHTRHTQESPHGSLIIAYAVLCRQKKNKKKNVPKLIGKD